MSVNASKSSSNINIPMTRTRSKLLHSSMVIKAALKENYDFSFTAKTPDKSTCQSSIPKPTLKRKLSGQDLSPTTVSSSSCKRHRPLSRISSMLSPAKPVKRVSQALQRSMTPKTCRARTLQRSSSISWKYQGPSPNPTPTKPKASKRWLDFAESNLPNQMTKVQIMRQEAIYELFNGEIEIVQDLKTLKEVYYNPMHTLKIMKPKELHEIFGIVHEITPLHEDLVQKIVKLQQSNGTVDSIGPALISWIPKLFPYLDYCAHLFKAKSALDDKRRDLHVADFLERCKQSPFSRKLDVWDFLDKPRSRLMKYALLFKNITKLTSTEHSDYNHLRHATSLIEAFVAKVDAKAGKAKCTFIQSKIFYVTDDQYDPLIDESQFLLCNGIVKNKAGTKLHVFLFEKILVLCRQATRDDVLMYQVHRRAIPITSLAVEDVHDENIRTNSLRGSFKDAISGGRTGKNLIRITSKSSGRLQYLIQANDEHDKKQWLNVLNQAITKCNHEMNV